MSRFVMPPMRGQIPMDLAPAPDFTFESYIEAPSNTGALSVVRGWPAWPTPHMLLLGPEGTGKTHLGEAWLRGSRGVFLDDAHTLPDDALFGFINRALRGEIPGLLMASRIATGDWDVALPDLRSRLDATPTIELTEPGDASLRPITRALFERRGRVVPDDVLEYLLRHASRSVPELCRTIGLIDQTASSAKADVTRAFVAKQLRESLSLFD